MKKIKNLEIALIREILFTIFAVLLSIPFWLNFDIASAAEIAKSYDNYYYISYELLNSVDYDLKPVSDSYAIHNVETQDIVVYNNSNTIQDYSLVLKVNKNDYSNVKINVNYDITYLDNYNRLEDTDNYYYILDSDKLVAGSKKYVISMWNDEGTINNNSSFDYELYVENPIAV